MKADCSACFDFEFHSASLGIFAAVAAVCDGFADEFLFTRDYTTVSIRDLGFHVNFLPASTQPLAHAHS
jgi:hypothetical protein